MVHTRACLRRQTETYQKLLNLPRLNVQVALLTPPAKPMMNTHTVMLRNVHAKSILEEHTANAKNVMQTAAKDVQITTPDVILANVNLVLKKAAKVVLGIDPIAGKLDKRVKSAIQKPTNPAFHIRVFF